MKIIYRVLMVASAAFFYVCAASAQGVPDHSVPIGRGPGAGFKFAAPAAVGTCLLSFGASSDPQFGACQTGSPGVDANTYRSMASSGNILTSDCGKTVSASGGFITITLPSVAGFDPSCQLTVVNSETGFGKKLSGFPANMVAAQGILWPQKGVNLKIVNGAWTVPNPPGRWQKTGAVYRIDNAGLDTNDGISQPLASLDRCFTLIHTTLDSQNSTPTCRLTSGQTFTACTNLSSGAFVGYNLIAVDTTGGSATLKVCAGGSSPLVVGDSAILLFYSIKFDCTGGSAACSGLFLHQAASIVDFMDSNSIFVGAASTNFAIQCDQGSRVNVNAGITYQGTFQTLAKLGPSCSVLHNNVMAISGVVAADLVQLATGSNYTFSGNTTFVGSATIARQGVATGNSVMQNVSGSALPGTATFFTASGGQNCTGAC